MICTININDTEIEYRIKFLKNTTRITAKISPKCGYVSISAPEGTKLSDIEAILINNADKILAQIAGNNEAVSFKNGDFFFLFGEPIKIHEVVTSERTGYSFSGNDYSLTVYTKEKDSSQQIYSCINDLFMCLAKKALPPALKTVHSYFKQLDIPMPKLSIRKMTSRWGSTNANKSNPRITLNAYLLQMPEDCINYVIFHEFTHFLYQNHQKGFYSFMEKAFPNNAEMIKRVRLYSTKLKREH